MGAEGIFGLLERKSGKNKLGVREEFEKKRSLIIFT